jgi:hypothetical protein
MLEAVYVDINAAKGKVNKMIHSRRSVSFYFGSRATAARRLCNTFHLSPFTSRPMFDNISSDVLESLLLALPSLMLTNSE